MLLSSTALYPVFQNLAKRVENELNLFANVEIIKRDSCDIGSLPEDICLVVYRPRIKAWYESKPDSRNRISKCFKEFYTDSVPESLDDNKFFKVSEEQEFKRIIFLRPYNFEKNKKFTKLYASSSSIEQTREGCYFDFCLSELREIIQSPKKLITPKLRNQVWAFKSCDFEASWLSNKVEW